MQRLVTREDCGTVSWGTLVSEDLIDAFTSTLEYLCPEEAARIKEEYKEVYERERVNVGYGMRWDIKYERVELFEQDARYRPVKEEEHFLDLVGWLINEELFNALNECCDEGVYFGTTEGDGADFGFWYSDEDDESESIEDWCDNDDDYEHDEDEDTSESLDKDTEQE